ncbi:MULTISPECIES: antibiotic biosynthesis monooxygenase [unclassified Sphingomonas]|uniref:antibiotic biosynthesis monooxygenase family protein n=1 Tax=unclassified Sphingomonas TaxID=196159 RepID=UPI000BC525A0|nr:MAG: antibiotic biosynthesis monooxygenase [Sphingomonas sp. 12-62-6]OYX40358.1 MAG: antibiotic biosynthesis monooxygenase [Sphingomonas sp. 32-62-10]OYY64590.1 MAG: antibiotic biosynthesis monooxygenase [Sphingomonas sp. 28-62-11]
MHKRVGQIAVIFVSVRTEEDDAGYAAAAAAMDALAAEQPGYRGMESVRGDDRLGITVSYWADDASAKAWRDHPDHKAIRDLGRARWYQRYDLVVAEVTRDYDWQRDRQGRAA